MEYHELSNLFPMMNKEEFADLCDDMRQNGYDQTAPIVIYENKILDGRNRQLAADTIGVMPNYIEFDGDDPLSFVIRHNLHRRHLNETQRAIISGKLETMKQGDNQYGHANWHDLQSVTRATAAKMMNVSPRTVARIKAIERNAPDLLELMEKGELSANKATTEMKRREVINNLKNIEKQEIKKIEGVYDVIVIDPPWPMQKIERDIAPNQVEFEYPTMTLEQINELKVPYADNCHVWLWTTHRFLPFAFELLKSWKLKYVCTFVWHKPGGFQPFGLPQYNCEFVLYAHKGSPLFLDTKQFNTCFNAPRGMHSEKPEEFYNMVKRVTGGRKLDMFNRRTIEGFDTWGNEAC